MEEREKGNYFTIQLEKLMVNNSIYRFDDATQSIVHIDKPKFSQYTRASSRKGLESGRRTLLSLAGDKLSSAPTLCNADTIGSIRNKPERPTYSSLPLASGTTSDTSSYPNESCDIQEHDPSTSTSCSDNR